MSCYLQGLGVSFGDRYRTLGNLDDIETALKLIQEAVQLTPEDHPDRAHYLQSLSNIISE
ncbi:hypothetical protein K438DRAFT_2077863 [Mycena galopus ATCC 62051]|nr:hypothetical protein K438DRAFT_2077863 [Mycena galopus ATCC 62051]